MCLHQLRLAANGVLGVPGYRVTAKHLAVREALGAERLQQARDHNPNGLQQIPAGIATRWLQIQDSAGLFHNNRLLIAAIMPITLAEGTDAHQIAAAHAVCSEKGFQDVNTIRYSAKIGKFVFLVNSPDFILQAGIARFLNLYCWRPLFKATADCEECSSLATRGSGSIIRIVLQVLRRELLVSVRSRRPGWKVLYRLVHRGIRGPPIAKSQG